MRVLRRILKARRARQRAWEAAQERMREARLELERRKKMTPRDPA